MPNTSFKADTHKVADEVFLTVTGPVSGPIEVELELTKHALVTGRIFCGQFNIQVPARLCIEVRALDVRNEDLPMFTVRYQCCSIAEYHSESLQRWRRSI